MTLPASYPKRGLNYDAAERAVADQLCLTAPVPDQLRLMDRMIFAPSGNWCLSWMGKCGSSSVLSALFHIEYGHPFSVAYRRAEDINENSAMHMLAQSRVFLPVISESARFASVLMNDPLRLTLSRHPAARVLSAFGYICRAQARASERFLVERINMNAMVGFDWHNDPGTKRGFERFLDYLALTWENLPNSMRDEHFAPIADSLWPDGMRYDLVLRLEQLGNDLTTLCERLNIPPAPVIAGAGHRNKGKAPMAEWLLDPAIQAKITALYPRDFETFDYDPELPFPYADPAPV